MGTTRIPWLGGMNLSPALLYKIIKGGKREASKLLADPLCTFAACRKKKEKRKTRGGKRKGESKSVVYHSCLMSS